VLLGMPPKFGSPAKASVTQVQNKINVGILSTDTDGNLSDLVSTVVLQNVANYLSRYRMINDYVVVKPASVINVGFEISILTESGSQINAISAIAQLLSNEFAQANMQLGQSYLVGGLVKKLSQIDGVLNINYIKAFNKVGGNYSTSTLDSSLLLDINTNEIDIHVLEEDDDSVGMWKLAARPCKPSNDGRKVPQLLATNTDLTTW
jgi:hypothetical protein